MYPYELRKRTACIKTRRRRRMGELRRTHNAIMRGQEKGRMRGENATGSEKGKEWKKAGTGCKKAKGITVIRGRGGLYVKNGKSRRAMHRREWREAFFPTFFSVLFMTPAALRSIEKKLFPLLLFDNLTVTIVQNHFFLKEKEGKLTSEKVQTFLGVSSV